MERVSEFISSQWCQEHGLHLAASVLVMLAFRVLSSFLDVKLKRYYATPTDVGNAVYRSVGLVHHTIQVPLAILVLCNPAFWHDRLHHSSPLSFAMVIISSGYFMHDTVHAIEFVSVQGPAYILHGLGCSAVFLFSLLQSPPALHFYGAGFLLWEVSSFFVHFRWFAYRHNLSSGLQMANGLLLVLSFFGARIVWGFYLTYLFVLDSVHIASPAFRYTLYASNLALNALNVWWFALILGKAVDTLRGSKPRSKKE